MNINYLKYFLVIAEYENITKAADALFISQPSLSQNLKNLEQELGCSLFDRNNNQLSLNRYGKTVQEHAKLIFNEIDALENAVEALKAEESQILRIASNNYTLAFPCISAFLTKHPQIKVEHLNMPIDALTKAILNGSIDFAITKNPLQSRGISSKIIYCDRYVALVPLTHPYCDRHELSLTDLENEKYVASSKQYNGQRYIDDLFKSHNKIPTVVFEGETGLQLKIFCSLNAIKIHLASQILDVPNAKAVPINDPAAVIEIYLNWSTTQTKNPTESTFFKFIGTCYPDYPKSKTKN